MSAIKLTEKQIQILAEISKEKAELEVKFRSLVSKEEQLIYFTLAGAGVEDPEDCILVYEDGYLKVKGKKSDQPHN